MIQIDHYTVRTHADDVSLREKSYEDFRASWPEFMQHSYVAEQTREPLNRLAAAFQLFITDSSGEIVGICRSVPMYWSGQKESLPPGYDQARLSAVTGLLEGRPINTLLGLSITVPARFRNNGIASIAIRALKQVGIAHQLTSVIIPVRPVLKASYPLIPIADYLAWKTSDGFPFDPWLRLHLRLGAEVLMPSADSMKIEGTVKEWESWTGLTFCQSGEYIIEGGGSPLRVDLALNIGTYYDPNIWVRYHIADQI